MRAEILYPILGAAFYFLGYWAKITEAIWSRYNPFVDSFMRCASCMGTWVTFGLATLFGCWKGWTFFGMPGDSPFTVIVAGLYGMVTIPLIARLHIGALNYLGVFEGEVRGEQAPNVHESIDLETLDLKSVDRTDQV